MSGIWKDCKIFIGAATGAEARNDLSGQRRLSDVILDGKAMKQQALGVSGAVRGGRYPKAKHPVPRTCTCRWVVLALERFPFQEIVAGRERGYDYRAINGQGVEFGA